MLLCVPVVSAEVVHCAAREVTVTLTQPAMSEMPSLKVAVPEGSVPPAGAGVLFGAMEAVKVTAWPVLVEFDGEAPVMVLVVLKRSTCVAVASPAVPVFGASVR